MSLDTYDVQGRPAWYSGAARAGNAGDLTIVPLLDTVAGVFMGTSPAPVDARAWGDIEIDWLKCGMLRATWRPEPHTALPAGQAEFRQLTGTLGAECNLEAYAAARNGQPVFVEFDIVP